MYCSINLLHFVLQCYKVMLKVRLDAFFPPLSTENDPCLFHAWTCFFNIICIRCVFRVSWYTKPWNQYLYQTWKSHIVASLILSALLEKHKKNEKSCWVSSLLSVFSSSELYISEPQKEVGDLYRSLSTDDLMIYQKSFNINCSLFSHNSVVQVFEENTYIHISSLQHSLRPHLFYCQVTFKVL